MADALIYRLDEIADHRLDLVGGKAANLGRLVRLGLPVPPGFVITTAAYRAFLAANGLEDASAEELRERILNAPIAADTGAPILEAYRRLGATAVAVRSSATAEDLAAASFAGQYDTILNVSGAEALLRAVATCWASLWAPRAVAYRRERGWGDGDSAIAVVVQRMVPADAAGVAFTANPVTGDRDETIISAVRGLGERLVSGEAEADEWVVRGADALCRRAPEGALTAEQARVVSNLARRIADQFGAPQDVEWALAGGAIFVLQARPMTALPEPVAWKAPLPGGWMRHFRLGEWLPEPLTPLCDSWLLPSIEKGEFAIQAEFTGVHPRPPYHVTVNGWYFSSPIGAGVSPRGVVWAVLRHPRRILALPLSLIRPRLAERPLLAPLAARWRVELLPRYQRLVESCESRVVSASPAELIEMIGAIADTAGEYFWIFSVVGGHAWKAERSLAAFYRRHLLAQIRRSHQELLSGLPIPFLEPPPHAVQSLDWFRPTLGETVQMESAVEAAGPRTGLVARRLGLEKTRNDTEAACRAALAGQRALLRRFEVLLADAQRYAIIREEQAGWFTLGWPVLRRAVLRLGAELCQQGAIELPDDVFFLTRSELEAGLAARPRDSGQDRRAIVAERREEWERQRRLSPPLALGKPPGEALLAGAAEVMRAPAPAAREGSATLTGMPASPGRATGPVRVVRGPDEFASFQPGEVLVAQVTAPAWTPLFERAAAVVTDSGSVAAHASLVAREYGIPAVVGTGDATARLRDGQVVTVDGSVGIVELQV